MFLMIIIGYRQVCGALYSCLGSADITFRYLCSILSP